MGLGLLSECGFWVSAAGDGVLDLKDLYKAGDQRVGVAAEYYLGLVRNKDVGGCGGFGGCGASDQWMSHGRGVAPATEKRAAATRAIATRERRVIVRARVEMSMTQDRVLTNGHSCK